MLTYEQQLVLIMFIFLTVITLKNKNGKKRFGSKAMIPTVGGTAKKKSFFLSSPFPGKQTHTENI